MEQLQQIVDKFREVGVEIYHLPASSLVEDMIFEPVRLEGLVLTQYKPSPLDGRWMIVKRIFDIVVSIVFLLLFGWIYILIALYILIRDGRPVLYVSQRVGK